MSLLRVDALSLGFGAKQVVDGVSFAIEKGEMLAVVGESGSGKSLTALSILGLQPAGSSLSGSIEFAGQQLLTHGKPASTATLRALRGKRISMIFQEPMTALNPLHAIGRQIGEMLDPSSPAIHRAQVQALLEQVGLAHFKDRLGAYPHELSGGERQRVMIAMAIANRPDLLIADEPTTAVDVTVQAKILELLKQLQREMGMSMLFISHDLTVVRRLADRVAVMQHGKLVEIGRTQEVFSAPQHEYTRHLLGSEPKGSPLPLQPDANTAIACEHLKVYFPIKKGLLRRVTGYIKAVDDISISIPESSTLGIVGESGSGKTTLAMALLRLVSSEGRILFMGQELQGLSGKPLRSLRSRMQLVFQDPYSSLNPRMSVRQIIEEGLHIHQPAMNEVERQLAVDAILRDVGLSPDMKDRYPHEFSGGQRQRISIARAMVLQPKLVVLDEPTSALDLSVQSQILDLLKRFQAQRGVSYIFISHDLRVVRTIAQQLVVMKRGQVVEQGDTASIFASPQSDYTKTLISAAFLQG
jgi:microcin C transport system ATP-binding protein